MICLKRIGLAACIAATVVSPAFSSGHRHSHYDDIGSTHYRNIDGLSVHRPTSKPEKKFGRISAVCRDGTYSYSRHQRGTCNFHGGVANWR